MYHHIYAIRKLFNNVNIMCAHYFYKLYYFNPYHVSIENSLDDNIVASSSSAMICTDMRA